MCFSLKLQCFNGASEPIGCTQNPSQQRSRVPNDLGAKALDAKPVAQVDSAVPFFGSLVNPCRALAPGIYRRSSKLPVCGNAHPKLEFEGHAAPLEHASAFGLLPGHSTLPAHQGCLALGGSSVPCLASKWKKGPLQPGDSHFAKICLTEFDSHFSCHPKPAKLDLSNWLAPDGPPLPWIPDKSDHQH